MNLKKQIYLLSFCLSVSTFFLPAHSYAQQLRYNFKNITPSDGLPSSEVYQVLQSSDHYMWFATDHGVCRYNGYEFKTFNLPDNSILGLYEDSKKRLWAYSFSGRLFYFENGKFDDYKWNNRLIGNLVSNVITGIYIDSTETLFVSASGPTSFKISDNGVIENLMKVESKATSISFQINRTDLFTYISGYPATYNFSLQNFTSFTELLFIYNKKRISITIPYVVQPERCRAKFITSNEIAFFSKNCFVWLKENGKYIAKKTTFSIDDIEEIDNHFYLATENGLIIQNRNGDILFEYFKGLHITSIEKDYEGGLWISTLTNAVFYLNHSHISHLAKGDKIINKQIRMLLKLNDSSVLAGVQGNEVIKFKVNSFLDSFSLDVRNIAAMYQINTSLILTGVSMGFAPTFWRYNNFFSIKGNQFLLIPNNSNFIKTGDTLYSGLTNNLLQFDINNLTKSPISSKLKFRVSKLFITQKKELLIGNLVGLWKYQNGELYAYDSTKQILSSRVTDIAEYKQKYICLGTRGKGLLFMMEDSIYQISTSAGLVSNNIRKIFIDHNNIWLATNSGISVVTIQSESPLVYSVKNISVQDGLLSNEVNDIINNGNEVIMATNSGISFINKDSVLKKATYKLPFYITEIKVNGNEADPHQLLLLNYKNRNLFIQFEALNYSNQGKNNYRYRLFGFDTAWLYTNDLNVQYNSLPYGNYQLQIQAKREFDSWGQSANIELPVRCVPAFWSTFWFFILSLASVLFLSYLFFRNRVSLLKKRQREKNELQRKIVETEQMALKSQMNPHFIFNSLNSIQQYVIDRDVKGANTFISGFSKLIRQTLDFSAKERITLAEEISYLTNYLDLEKMRMENKFRYEVDVQTHHALSELEIPPLLLQPYVENALRHGVLFLENKEGVIRLSFNEQNGILECVIEDNGIGRIKAMQLKSNNAIEYQSKGMSLTENRIELLNKALEKPIQIIIEDLHDEQNATSGTSVKVLFPV